MPTSQDPLPDEDIRAKESLPQDRQHGRLFQAAVDPNRVDLIAFTLPEACMRYAPGLYAGSPGSIVRVMLEVIAELDIVCMFPKDTIVVDASRPTIFKALELF